MCVRKGGFFGQLYHAQWLRMFIKPVFPPLSHSSPVCVRCPFFLLYLLITSMFMLPDFRVLYLLFPSVCTLPVLPPLSPLQCVYVTHFTSLISSSPVCVRYPFFLLYHLFTSVCTLPGLYHPLSPHYQEVCNVAHFSSFISSLPVCVRCPFTC